MWEHPSIWRYHQNNWDTELCIIIPGSAWDTVEVLNLPRGRLNGEEQAQIKSAKWSCWLSINTSLYLISVPVPAFNWSALSQKELVYDFGSWIFLQAGSALANMSIFVLPGLEDLSSNDWLIYYLLSGSPGWFVPKLILWVLAKCIYIPVIKSIHCAAHLFLFPSMITVNGDLITTHLDNFIAHYMGLSLNTTLSYDWYRMYQPDFKQEKNYWAQFKVLAITLKQGSSGTETTWSDLSLPRR